MDPEQSSLVGYLYGRNIPDGEEWDFFDLLKDPKEMKSVYSDPKYIVHIAELKKELQRLRKYYDVPAE